MIPIGLIRGFLYLLFTILDLTILAEVILSYIPNVKGSNFYRILVSFNYPILRLFRKLQESFLGDIMIDFSPILAFMTLNFISGILL